jgi:hypothetical protein
MELTGFGSSSDLSFGSIFGFVRQASPDQLSSGFDRLRRGSRFGKLQRQHQLGYASVKASVSALASADRLHLQSGFGKLRRQHRLGLASVMLQRQH